MEESMKLKTTNMEGKGGFKAASFVYALISLEGMGFVANMVSLVLYFQFQLYFQVSAAANTVTNLMGSTFLLSIFGAFISDTYINRFKTTLIFGVLEVVGLMLMTIQARYKELQPEPCGKASCLTGGIAVMFFASLSLLAMGSGGVRGALPALGADQFNHKDPKESKALPTYFNFLLFSTTVGSTIGVTVIVWVATNKNWWPGFLISLLAAIVGFLFLSLGKPFFRLQVPGESPLLRVIQVIVVAIKNRSLAHPNDPDQLYELNEKETSVSSTDQIKIQHSKQFRWLDKAAVLRDNSGKPTPWTVCTVTQVEEVKVLTRMLPIIASTIILNTCMAQLQTFSVTQGFFMNRYIGSFQVPAPSVPVIPLVFMSILIPIYEFIFVPLARKITKHPSGITQLQRVGVGLVLSVVSMAVAGVIEVKRKNHDLKYGKPIHVAWLSFQYGIFGIADMFSLVGLLEFFYKEAPVGMRSLSTSFTWLSMSLGYFLSSIFVEVINSVTKRASHEKRGWLEGVFLDQNHLDYFFWFLAILSLLNFFNYLYWASWYKYKSESDEATTVPGYCAPQSFGLPPQAQDEAHKLDTATTDAQALDEATKIATTPATTNGVSSTDAKTDDANGKS